MPRPKDEDGLPLKPPHLRLPLRDLSKMQEAALYAMAADTRGPALEVKRKLAMIDKAIDHVIDGDAAPKWIYAPDDDEPDNHFLVDLWGLAVVAVRVAYRQQAVA